MIFFVTGGSRGIGRQIVLQALDAGHDVGFTFRTNEHAAQEVLAAAAHRAPDRRCRAYQLDVRDSAGVEAVGDRAVDDFGTVEVVVSNAGVNLNGLAVTMSDEEWRTVIDTNLTGSFYVCRQFLPVLLANGRGRIVLISSIGHTGVSGMANYAASKAGLHGLSATLAREYGRKNITTNVVVPGFFETDMTRGGMAQWLKEYWVKYCPVGRMGQVEEVARVVLFLTSDDASFINGQLIPVTGGLDWAP